MDAEDEKNQSQKPSKSTFISLKTVEFPEKYENEFNIKQIARNQNDEKILNGEKDRRYVCDTNKYSVYSRIGQLRMQYTNINKYFVGTATIFYYNPVNHRLYAITSAHNLVHYDEIEAKTHNLEHIWFDHRITNNYKIYSYSKSIKKYKVDTCWPHPLYNPKERMSPYDIAIVSFVHDNNDVYWKNHISQMNNISQVLAPKTIKGVVGDIVMGAAKWIGNGESMFVEGRHSKGFAGISLFGFPAEKQGQLWGEQIEFRTTCGFRSFKDGKMISYKIHTTGGQSGSSIIDTSHCSYSGGQFTIIGIHKGGQGKKNYAVKITESNIKWISQCVQEIEINTKGSKIIALFKYPVLPNVSLAFVGGINSKISGKLRGCYGTIGCGGLDQVKIYY